MMEINSLLLSLGLELSKIVSQGVISPVLLIQKNQRLL